MVCAFVSVRLKLPTPLLKTTVTGLKLLIPAGPVSVTVWLPLTVVSTEPEPTLVTAVRVTENDPPTVWAVGVPVLPLILYVWPGRVTMMLGTVGR